MKIQKYGTILEFHNINKKMKITHYKINKQTKSFNFIVEIYQMQLKIQIFS
jgi:hypothetical protein